MGLGGKRAFGEGLTMLKLRRLNAGTSIIEVLVMMVVLLIGIMTVVRMFPGGFFVLRRAENHTFASRLAQAEIERWKLRATNLPAGIVPLNDAGNVDIKMDPGPPFNSGDYTKDERVLGKRRIVGETTKIPIAGEVRVAADASIYGSVYMLGFSPIANASNINVYSSPLQRYVRNSDVESRPWDWLPSVAYAIDYGNEDMEPKIAFPSLDYDRKYKITYSWWERPLSDPNAEPVLRVTTVEMFVRGKQGSGAGFGEQWLDVPLESSGRLYRSMAVYAEANNVQVYGIDDYSESVSRAFNRLTGTPQWSGDPYEYAVLDEITGILVFNPNGYNYTERTPQGVKPLVARIDYDLLDPGIMREDKTVSRDHPYNLKLTLNYVYPDQPLAPGSLSDECKMLIVDTVEGSKVVVDYDPVDGPVIVVPNGSGTDRLKNYLDIDYKAGVITFLTDTVPAIDLSGQRRAEDIPVAGHTFRVYYRADGDWVMQVMKPYELYARQDDPASVDYWHYGLVRHVRDGRPRYYLYFPICDAGKSVSVDFTWIEERTAADGSTEKIQHSIAGESYQISTDKLSVASGHEWCYVDLNSKHDEIANHASGERLNIRAVRGTSLKVRVFWREGGKVWQFADAETSLQKQPEDI